MRWSVLAAACSSVDPVAMRSLRPSTTTDMSLTIVVYAVGRIVKGLMSMCWMGSVW